MDMSEVAVQTLVFYLQLLAVLAGTGAVTALVLIGAWRVVEAAAARRRESEAAAAVEQEWRRREHLGDYLEEELSVETLTCGLSVTDMSIFEVQRSER